MLQTIALSCVVAGLPMTHGGAYSMTPNPTPGHSILPTPSEGEFFAILEKDFYA